MVTAPILLVDDLEENLLALEALLRRDDAALLTARSGRQALEVLLENEVALAIIDAQMPELDGFELIARLRKDDRFKTTPIVIITSRANPEHRRRARDLGVRALVAKPITRRKLLEALATR